MKKILLVLVLLIGLSSEAQDYWVTTSGSSGNNGTSEGTAWTFAHALANAPIGSEIAVKAGNYGDINLTINTANLTIIGYKTTPNDIIATTAPTVVYPATVDAAEMPLITMSNPASGLAFQVNGANSWVENIQVTNGGHAFAIAASAANSTFKNCIVTEMGGDGEYNNSNQPYEGFGLISHAPNTTYFACAAYNVGAQSMQFKSSSASNSQAYYNHIHSGNFNNATDYGILISSNTLGDPITGVEIAYSKITRVAGLWHGMHGIDMKHESEGHWIHHNVITATQIELSMPGSKNHIVEYNTITDYGVGYAHWQSGIMLYNNGGNGSIIRNNTINTGDHGIVYAGNNENLIGYPLYSTDTGYNDVIIENNIFINLRVGILSNTNADGHNELGNRLIEDNIIRNNVFKDVSSMMAVDMEFVNPTFENNILYDVANQFSSANDVANNTQGVLSGTITSTNNKYYGASAQLITGFTATTDPLFVNTATIPEGFKTQAGSPLINPISDAGSLLAFDGGSKNGTRDIGPYEDGGIVAPPDSGSPIVTSMEINTITDIRAWALFSLNEGSRASIWYDTDTGTAAMTANVPDDYPLETFRELNYLTTHYQPIGDNPIGTNPDLSPSTTYYFRVLTEDSSANFGLSDEYSFTTLADPNPSPSPSKIGIRNKLIKIKKL